MNTATGLSLPIYLDNSATTPLDPRVVDAMLPYLTTHFGNPASTTHEFGRIAMHAVERARAEVAALVNADEREIVWTSGATESNNLAIKGAAAAGTRGKRLVTVQTEHKAVLDTMKELERAGYEVTYLAPEPNGLVDPQKFAAALRPDTQLASVMLVNNEIGVIQDIAALGEVCRERGIVFHVDAAQATGKVAIDLKQLPVDLMSLTAHKTYGPKGIGALYVRRGARVAAQMHGGGHERGMRSGTLPTHQIVGMGACFRLAQEDMATEVPRLRSLRDRLWAGISDLPELRINGDMERRIANNLNLSVSLPDCDALVTSLTDIAVSSTSACSSGSAMPSHVLQALGAEGSSTIRLTIGRFNTVDEIDHAIRHLRDKLEECRARKAA
ncbi:MAG TPA: aminotransferase class V-fold PLP-dependent enzyme [Burkholderiales bacterium]|nr:aminotransferase class V-fold PLP-dependent enzyme [Burkholderiales bacterium]